VKISTVLLILFLPVSLDEALIFKPCTITQKKKKFPSKKEEGKFHDLHKTKIKPTVLHDYHLF